MDKEYIYIYLTKTKAYIYFKGTHTHNGMLYNLKKEGNLPLAAILMNLENSMLSEIN